MTERQRFLVNRVSVDGRKQIFLLVSVEAYLPSEDGFIHQNRSAKNKILLIFLLDALFRIRA